MRKIVGALALSAALVGIGCEREGDSGEVVEEIRDLREAQENAPTQVAELERELAEAEGRVVDLRERLELARQGVTGDVIRERQELEAALNEQEREVSEDVRAAAQQAREHNQAAEVAQRELAEGQEVQSVQGYVESRADVQTEAPRVDERRTQREIGVERTDIEG